MSISIPSYKTTSRVWSKRLSNSLFAELLDDRCSYKLPDSRALSKRKVGWNSTLPLTRIFYIFLKNIFVIIANYTHTCFLSSELLIKRSLICRITSSEQKYCNTNDHYYMQHYPNIIKRPVRPLTQSKHHVLVTQTFDIMKASTEIVD